MKFQKLRSKFKRQFDKGKNMEKEISKIVSAIEITIDKVDNEFTVAHLECDSESKRDIDSVRVKRNTNLHLPLTVQTETCYETTEGSNKQQSNKNVVLNADLINEVNEIKLNSLNSGKNLINISKPGKNEKFDDLEYCMIFNLFFRLQKYQHQRNKNL